jgi:uncharacterized coiled-coil DUF342 family protein
VEARDDFWERIQVAVNADWEEEGVQFVNPVDVQDMFAEATGWAAFLAAEAEELTGEIANYDVERGQVQRRLAKLRRTIMADGYAKLAKSAGSEVIDAFVFASATDGQKTQILQYEDEIEALSDEINMRKPRLARLENRLKRLEKNMEFAKQYLDYDKLLERLKPQNRGRA